MEAFLVELTDIVMMSFNMYWLLIPAGLIAFLIFDFNSFGLDYDYRPFTGIGVLLLIFALIYAQNFYELEPKSLHRIMDWDDRIDLEVIDRFSYYERNTYKKIINLRIKVGNEEVGD